MVRASDTVDIEGPVGRVQTLVDEPEVVRGLALVAHPHPLFGGNNANKVVYTLAHCLRDLGYLALRPNFRGVGRSDGTYDHGRGETDDLLAVLDHAARRWGDAGPLPVVLAGFSFGAFVQTKVTRRLSEAGRPYLHRMQLYVACLLAERQQGYLSLNDQGGQQYQLDLVVPLTLVS